MTRRNIHSGIVTLILLLMTPLVVLGQNTNAVCNALTSRAFSDLGNNCAGLASNEVCYGYGQINATVYVDGELQAPANDFGEGERISLFDGSENTSLATLSASPFTVPANENEASDWGIVVANLQANLPAQLDGNGAKLLLFGDASIENAVLPENTFVLNGVVDVTTDGASIFTVPPAYSRDVSEVIETVSGNFEADAISPDGQWVRVFYLYDVTYGQRATAWLQVSDLTSTSDLSALPILGANNYAPLQSFYFSGSPRLSDCELVPPNGVLIQSLTEIETDIVVNNVPIRISSSAFFDMLSPRALRVSALAGVVQINHGTDNPVVIAVAEEAIICLADDLTNAGIGGVANNRVYDPICGIQGAYVFGTEASSVSDSVLSRFQALRDIPSNLLHYTVPTITIVRASGVGVAQLSIIVTPIDYSRRIKSLCSDGLIPGEICERLQ